MCSPSVPAGPVAIALVTDSRHQPRWLAEAFARAQALGTARVEAVVDLGRKPRLQPWLWRLYRRADQQLLGKGREHDDACDLHSAITARRVIEVASPEEARQALEALGVDVLFVLGDVPHATFEGVARYGLWRYGFGPDGRAVDPSAAASPVGEPVTASALLARLPGERCERVLCRAWSHVSDLSVARTLRGMLPRTSEFVARALGRLRESGPGWLANCEPAGERPDGAADSMLRTADCVVRLARFAPHLAARTLRRLLYVDQWFIAWRFDPDFAVPSEAGWDGDLRGFHFLVPPRDRLWADPFAIERDGRHYVLFEELPFAAHKAHISVVEVGADGRHSPPVPVLERDYHLSYPFLVEHEGELYMVPESGANRTVEVYRCVSFPDRWVLHAVPLEGVCTADATLFRADGRWWMFVGVFAPGSEFADGAEELHLYYADDLRGPWKPHRANPVKSDVRGTRPAGALYRTNGGLYRPAQIGVPIYGAGLSINRVLRLDEREFVEREVAQIRPRASPGVLGLHTLNRAGSLVVVDAFTRSRRWG